MSYFQYSLTAPLSEFAIGTPPGKVLVYRVLFLPPELEQALFGEGAPVKAHGGRLRIEGELEDVPVSLAWQPSKSAGGHYVMVSPALCKQLELRIGSEATLRFNVVDASKVVLPEDLEAALRASAKHRKLWHALTPGQQRGQVALLSSAKTAPTRQKRLAQLFAMLEQGGPERRGMKKKPPARNGRRAASKHSRSR